VRAIVLAPLEEAVKRGMVHPNTPHDALIPRVVPIQETSAHKPKAYVRISCTYSCKKCQKDMEVALAKGPSWCIVEINRGPDPENRIIVAT
jgi:hypothetical protein